MKKLVKISLAVLLTAGLVLTAASCSKKEKKTYDFSSLSSSSSKSTEKAAADLDSLLDDLSALAGELEGTAADALKGVDDLLKDTGADKLLDTAKGALDLLGDVDAKDVKKAADTAKGALDLLGDVDTKDVKKAADTAKKATDTAKKAAKALDAGSADLDAALGALDALGSLF